MTGPVVIIAVGLAFGLFSRGFGIRQSLLLGLAAVGVTVYELLGGAS